MRNLHAAVYKNAETRDEYNALQSVELVLHRGTSYGRGVFKAKPGLQETENLRNRLNSIKEKVRNSEEEGGQDGSAESSGITRERDQETEAQCDSSSAIDRAGPLCSEENVNHVNRRHEITEDSQNNGESAENIRQGEKRGLSHPNTLCEKSPSKKVVRLSQDHECERQAHFITPVSPELQLSCDPSVSPRHSDQDLELNRCMMDTATGSYHRLSGCIYGCFQVHCLLKKPQKNIEHMLTS